MILLIDNYDSFTYIIADYLKTLGEKIIVYRNDKISLSEAIKLSPDYLIISPGPSIPSNAGISKEFIEYFSEKIPILGICLGHQAIGEVFGCKIIRAPEIFHGKVSKIYHNNDELFFDIPSPFKATRYHSLIIDPKTLNKKIEVIARTSNNIIMGIRIKGKEVWGVQFHPESILSEYGIKILKNFIGIKKGFIFKKKLNKIIEGKNLKEHEIENLFINIMSGKLTPVQIAGFITALRMKTETIEEITGAAKVMRKFMTKIKRPSKRIIADTCGTGGDSTNTFNISTAAAFVTAGANITVAKHGNRSVSSKSGSADILEALGIKIDIPKQAMEEALERIGISFLFAPLLHPSMKYAITPRKELGIRTIFNILGPLANPADADAQVIGVYDIGMTKKIAEVLIKLGVKSAYVVASADGLDEISNTAITYVSRIKKGWIKSYILDSRKYGIKRASIDELRVSSVKESCEIVLKVLKGKKGPHRDITLLNSAAAISAAKNISFKNALFEASKSIDTGNAFKKLEMLKEFTASFK